MTITFTGFIQQAISNPALLMISLLTLAVILVNGWTDAPNAIATAISTRAMAPRPAILMAAIMNFLGVFVMMLFSSSVAQTITRMVNFGDNSREALIGLCAALVAIVVWATAAWWFGIPTSESHALIAGLSGAAIAMHGSIEGINLEEWKKVIYGLLLTAVGFVVAFAFVRLVELICRNLDRRKTVGFFGGAQIFGAASMAFVHGAQDGQKFIGVFMLAIFLAQGQSPSTAYTAPIWLMVLCSLVMGLGTSIGGTRIIKTVGMDMVKLEKYQGFAADFSAAIVLFVFTLLGLPVSTTHIKTVSIMGVGASKRLSSVNWGIAGEMVGAWLLTFPGCGLIGFLMAKLFMLIFG